MPTWGDIVAEIDRSRSPALPLGDIDGIRRKYIQALQSQTGRNLIVYATAWMQNKLNVPQSVLSVVPEDVQGFMQALYGLEGDSLDLILHSPGGDLGTAEAIVDYLRSRFSDIRVIVPGAAMSAACIIACAANTIVMGKHSFLGPIDPQFQVNGPAGNRMCAAHAILEQFALAKTECRDQSNLAAWLPMLNQYGPDLLIACRNAITLSQSLASKWLESHMFKDDPPAEASAKAELIAEWLCNHKEMMSHGRFLSADLLRSKGMKIASLEADGAFQDAVLSVFHAITLCFSSTPLNKVIENHLGKAFMKLQPLQMMGPPTLPPAAWNGSIELPLPP